MTASLPGSKSRRRESRAHGRAGAWRRGEPDDYSWLQWRLECSARAHGNIAAVLSEMRMFAAAEAEYREAVRLNNGRGRAYQNLVLLLLFQGSLLPPIMSGEWPPMPA